MKTPKPHNEYFQPIAKRSCNCGNKKCEMYSWGEYVRGNWRTIDHFCQKCFTTHVLPRL